MADYHHYDYEYKRLSEELGIEIKNENQYLLALQGASKKTVEDDKIESCMFPLTEEFKQKFDIKKSIETLARSRQLKITPKN